MTICKSTNSDVELNLFKYDFNKLNVHIYAYCIYVLVLIDFNLLHLFNNALLFNI